MYLQFGGRKTNDPIESGWATQCIPKFMLEMECYTNTLSVNWAAYRTEQITVCTNRRCLLYCRSVFPFSLSSYPFPHVVNRPREHCNIHSLIHTMSCITSLSYVQVFVRWWSCPVENKFIHTSSLLMFTFNEENSPTFDRRVSPLVGAATQESNVWVLSVKGRKKEK
jgi:hypothetical protein